MAQANNTIVHDLETFGSIERSSRPSNWTGLAMVATTLLVIMSSMPAWSRDLPDFETLIDEKADAVVSILTSHSGRAFNMDLRSVPETTPMPRFFRRFFENDPRFQRPPPERSGLGSGFIIAANGYVVTNAHVVKGASEIKVGLYDGRELIAELIGEDARTDLALLRIEATGLPTLILGDSDELNVGQWVLAIGAPFGFEHTATQGIVSAVSRSLPRDNYVPFIQTDVAVNPGNSGGPLFDLDGQVIGINSQIYSRTGGYQGVSFAIPANLAKSVIARLKDKGSVTRGWLGVTIQSLDTDLATSFQLKRTEGALVSSVQPGSPADRAGLMAGDVLLRYDGRPLENSRQLPPLVAATPIGTKVALQILRSGKRKTLTATVAALDEPPAKTTLATMPSGRLGIVVRAAGDNDQGVTVTDVAADSPAATAGIRKKDKIIAIADRQIKTTEDFVSLLKRLPAGKPVPVLLVRGKTQLFLAVKPT